MKSAQPWYSGRAGSENGTKEWVSFRVSVWRLWTPERLLGDKGPPCSWRKGHEGIPSTVSVAWLEDALEKFHFMLLAVTVKNFCRFLVRSSGHGQWNKLAVYVWPS